MEEEDICVGIVLKPIGIKGQVKILPYTTSPKSFLALENIYFENRTNLILKSPKVNEKGMIFAFIDGYESRN
jgi:ribosomal 30S subunit maturation factor RimM